MNGSIDYYILFSKSNDINLFGYSDFNYTRDANIAKSTLGKIIFYRSNPIFWNAQIQKSVSLLSTEVEYYTLTSIAKDLIYYKQICEEIQLPFKNPITIKVNNQSTIKFASNSKFSPKNKHINTKHHFIKDLITEKTFKLEYVPTDENLADFFTKALVNKFQRFKDLKPTNVAGE